MNKQRKTSNILNVFQYDEITGAVTLPSTLVVTAPAAQDNSTKVPTTQWVQNYVGNIGYQLAFNVTTNGSSGAATFTNNTLNIPVYSLSGLGGEPAITAGTASQYWRGDKTFQTLNTTAVVEGTNLYFTNARSRAAISVTGSGSYDSATGVITVTGGVTSVNTLTGAVTLTTTNIGEGTNLYYTTARVNSDFDTRLATKSTTNLAEGTNLYYTDARVGTYLTNNSYATQSYVSTQISNLVASAPATLDTLNELAAALGNDANFSTTISTALGNRLRVDINTQGLTSTQQGYGRTNLGLGSLATLSSVANAQITDVAWSKVTGAPAFITGYTEVDTLASVTARGSSTTGSITINGYTTIAGGADLNLKAASGNTDTGDIVFQDGSGNELHRLWQGSSTLNYRTNGGTTYSLWHSGNLTNLNQLTNGPGYITSYTETDTLSSVTGRGASTSTAITLNTGGNIVSTSTWEKWKLVTTGVTAPARQGSDANGLNFTSNALWNSGWSQDDSTKKSMAYIQHLGNGRHEFRTSASGGTVSWVVGLTIDETAATFSVPLTGSSFIKSGGTSAQFLMADGSVSTNPGWITSYTETDTLATVTGRGASTSTNVTFNGTLTSAGQTVLAGAFRFYTGGTDGSTAYGDFRTNPATGNSIISAKSNALYFNYDHGTGGVIFCDGATGIVATVSAAGVAVFNGNVTGASFIKSGGTSSQFLKADGSVDSSTYLTSITSSQVTTALGYTPYNAGSNTVITNANYTSYALRWNSTSSYGSGLDNTSVVPNSVTLFDGYGAAVPGYPSGANQWWVGALTIGDANRGFQIAGGYADSDMYFRKGNTTWGTWRKVWTDANLTNLNQLTNGPGYITSYTETDTLASVTARGATTTGAITVNGNLRTAIATSNVVKYASGVSSVTFGNALGGNATDTSRTVFFRGAGNASVWWGAPDANGDNIPHGAIDSLSTGGLTHWYNSGGTGGGTWTKIMTVDNNGVTVNSGNFIGGLSGNATSATQVVTIQDTAPSTANGKLWWESTTGKLKVYYSTSSAWVDVLPMPDMNLYYAKAGGAITGNVNIQQSLTVDGVLNMNTSGTSYIRMGRFPNSTTNTGEAWIGRASDRSTGTMTVQLGGSSNGSFFEIVDYGWTTVTFKAGMNDFSYKGNTIYHAGNLTNLNQLTNGPGYLTSVSLTSNVTGTLPVANGGTASTTRKAASGSIANFGQLENHGTYTDANSVQQWGGTYIQGSTNTPNFNGAVQHYQMMLSLGADYEWGSGNTYAAQIAFARNVSTPYIGIRYKEGGANTAGWNSWQKISAGYADSANSVVTIQDSPPTGSDGKLWWESDTGRLKVYYGTASAWIDAIPIPDMSLYYPKAGGSITGNVTVQQTLNVVGNTLVQGNINAFGDITAYSSSDIRLKDNITVIESPLDKISKINGVSFNWNDKQSVYEIGKKDYGVIAQEVEEVLPELVTTRDNGYKAVRYEKIVPLLIESIKEQQVQISELKTLVNMLTDKLNNL